MPEEPGDARSWGTKTLQAVRFLVGSHGLNLKGGNVRKEGR